MTSSVSVSQEARADSAFPGADLNRASSCRKREREEEGRVGLCSLACLRKNCLVGK